MLPNCTGKLVGFIYSFLLAYTNAKWVVGVFRIMKFHILLG
jgi:hypothetical protein